MTEMRSKARQCSEGFQSGFTRREYLIWETDMWREGWLLGTAARVAWAVKASAAIASMGIDTSAGRE